MGKYKRELYDQKNGFTRNEYFDKIARELSELLSVQQVIFAEAPAFCLHRQVLQICAFPVPILKRNITRHQVDNTIRRIEWRFKNRNDRQKSGAGNLSQWSLEERVAATIGDRPTVHVETVSSLRADSSKGK